MRVTQVWSVLQDQKALPDLKAQKEQSERQERPAQALPVLLASRVLQVLPVSGETSAQRGERGKLRSDSPE
jgi:hypothetical protein